MQNCIRYELSYIIDKDIDIDIEMISNLNRI